jgi:fibronectin type 3 domain-containing protein
MGATLDIPLPPAITQASMQGKTAIITWTQVDGRAVKYDIIKKGAGETQEIQGVTSQRFEDRALKPGERYTYEIISVDENGLSSKPSQEVLIQAPKE